MAWPASCNFFLAAVGISQIILLLWLHIYLAVSQSIHTSHFLHCGEFGGICIFEEAGDNWAARGILDLEVVIFTMKVCG